MAWTKYQLFLAGLMLVTGSINTLSAKWADNFVAEGCGGSQEHSFKHPFVQAVGMFLGEFSCLAAFYLLKCQGRRQSASSVEPQQPFNTLLFLPPALCDMTGTSIMYVGNISSIAFFNFSGISVTKELSATTRMVLDTLRTIVIWAFTLALGWEIFYPLQILGFLILLMGTALYNGLHRPLLAFLSRRWRLPTQEGEQERLLGDSRTPINEAS